MPYFSLLGIHRTILVLSKQGELCAFAAHPAIKPFKGGMFPMSSDQVNSSVLSFLLEMPTQNGTLLRDILQLFEKYFQTPISLTITFQEQPDRHKHRPLKYNYIVRDLPLHQVANFFDAFFDFNLLERLQGEETVVSLSSLLSKEEQETSPYCQFLRDMGAPYQSFIFLREENALLAILCLFRDEEDFSPEELAAFTAIEPFITKQYLENRKNRERMSLAYHFDEYFSGLSMGVALLDRNGKILQANDCFNEYAHLICNSGIVEDIFVTRNTAGIPERFLWGQRLLNFFGAQSLYDPESIKMDLPCAKFKLFSKELVDQNRTVIHAGENYHLLFLVRQEKIHSAQMLEAVKRLTPKESAVLGYLTAGMTNAQIAQEMSISPFTVKTHLQNIYSKFHVSGRSELLSKWR